MFAKKNVLVLLSLLVAVFFIAGVVDTVGAEEKPWWPFPIEDWQTGKAVTKQYVPLKKASKKWKLYAVVPHLKDSWWLAVTYGEVAEARRLGVELTIFDAGGYPNLNKQISQYNDAIAGGADAILPSVVSEAGLSKKIQEGKDKGIIQVAVGNPVHKAPVDSKVYTDQVALGYAGGKMAVEYFKNANRTIRAVQFPGPQGSGWAEESAKGFRQAIKGTNIELLEEKYGDTGKEVQLKLVEDSLQTHGKLDLLFGVAVMAEVAVQAVEEMGLTDTAKIISWYSNIGVIGLAKRGDILSTITQRPVMIGRLGVELAVRALEGKPFSPEIHMVPLALTKDNIKAMDMTKILAPKNYRAVYHVK